MNLIIPCRMCRFMGKWLFFGVLLLTSISHLYAQQTEIAQLRAKLHTSNNDSIRTDAMLALVLRYLQKNTDSSLYFAEQALYLAQKNKDLKRQAAAQHQLGQSKLFKGLLDEARDDFAKALALAEKSQHILVKAHVLASLGGTDYSAGNFDQAMAHFIKALRSYEQIGDSIGQARILNNLGALHYELANYEQSLKTLLKALTIKQAINDLHTIGNTYTSIGDALAAKKRYNEALVYYQKAIQVHQEQQAYQGLSIVYTNIGFLHNERRDFDSASHYYQKALLIEEQMGNQEGVAINLMNLADVWRSNKSYVKSELALNQALAILQKLKMKNQVQKVLKDLAGVQADQGKYAEAFQTLQAFVMVKDSIFSEQKSRQIAEIETKYQTEKKEQENQLLQAKNERNRLWLYAATAVILLLLALFWAIVKAKQWQLKNAQTALKLQTQMLRNYATNLLEKDEFITEMQLQLAKSQQEHSQQKVDTINTLLKARISTEDDWLLFRQRFELMYPDFFMRLQQKFPQLSSNEVKICAIEKLGLKDIQAGDLLGVNPSSVKKSRYRLRKNLDKHKQEELQQFITNFPNA